MGGQTDLEAKTLERCAAEGWPAARVSTWRHRREKVRKVDERGNYHDAWLATPHRRIDLWGCIDILAIRDGQLVGIQATDYTSQSKRFSKMRTLLEGEANKPPEQQPLTAWLNAGNALEVWSWKGRHWETKSGEMSRHKRWEAKIVPVTLEACSVP